MKPGLVQSLSNLQVRIISAFFIGLLFITAIFFIRPLFLILVTTIAAIMLAEWYDMAHLKKNYLYSGLIIISIPIASLFYISEIDYNGWLLATFFIIIWSVDSFAMFIGKWLQGPKLAPILSPKKTISGLLGGITAGVLFPLLLKLIPSYKLPYYGQISNFLLIGQFIILAGVAQASDLFISYFKRKFKIKDSGNIIPGHGGMLDRFDSIILTAPIVAFYLHSQKE